MKVRVVLWGHFLLIQRHSVTAMPGEINTLLLDLQHGNPETQSGLIPLVYRAICRIASAHLRGEAWLRRELRS